MKLVENARAVFFGSWTVRLALISALLSGVEFAMTFIPQSSLKGWMAGAALLVSLGAAVARIVQQPKLRALLFPDTVPQEGSPNA